MNEITQSFSAAERIFLSYWADRLIRIGDSILKRDVRGRKSIGPRVVSKFRLAAWDRGAVVNLYRHSWVQWTQIVLKTSGSAKLSPFE